jgi:large subunit ribosomal protein L3
VFEEGDIVHVVGKSKGRGFAGGVKRHHFAGGPKTHGQSDRHRAPGSIGSGTTPGRVRKGLRMAGHMGDEKVTVKNLRIFQADTDRGVLLIEGNVPGGINGIIRVTKTGRKGGKA